MKKRRCVKSALLRAVLATTPLDPPLNQNPGLSVIRAIQSLDITS